MKLSPLLALLLLFSSVTLCPEITLATSVPIAQADSALRVQQLITQQKYELAWQEIRRVAKQMDRNQVTFPIPAWNGGGSEFLTEWSLKLGEAQLQDKQYKAAFQFAKSNFEPMVQLEIAKKLHFLGESQLADSLFSNLVKNYKKLPKADAQYSLANLSGDLFNLGQIETSNDLLSELISSMENDQYLLQNQKITIFQGAGLKTENLDRTIEVMERLKLLEDSTTLDDSSVQSAIVSLAIREGNGPVAEIYLQQLGRSYSKAGLWYFHYDLANLYFSQQQSALGLKHLGEALIYAQINLENGSEWRDGRLQDVALLYHQQKQNRKAESTARKIRSLELKKHTFEQLKKN
ncbi:MAG: hypothetical protein HC771_11015 [Synechococcales cyanobacterium CRU_2_2]|nr:hypothetical protein [Synechococcales cyanobacterium CRU_2_2]